MSKKKKIKNSKDKIVRSINNNIRSSVRKLNPLLKTIVGKKVETAIRDLEFSEKRISNEIKKTISSAVANAEHNNSSDLDELFVKNVLVDEGPYGKRHSPRARGRVNQILKRTSHITIVVSDKEDK